MKKMIVYAIVFLMTLNSCKNKDGIVEITGNIQNYPDGTMVVLHNFNTNKGVDTTYIVNNKFNCTVQNTKACPYEIFIGEGQESEYLFLFVENVDILVNGEKGKIKYAKVNGGAIQKQHNTYFSFMRPYELKLDSITNALMKAMEKQDMDKVEAISQQQMKILQEENEFDLHYIRENPNIIYSAFLLENLRPRLPKSEINELYENLFPAIKECDYAKSTANWLKNNKEVKVGDIAEDFTLSDVNGNRINLKKFLGKFVLLEFWEVGCAGCVNENKNISIEYDKYKEKGLEIISVSRDKNLDNLKRASEESIPWYSLQDTESKNGYVATRYGVTLVPSNFLIDPAGRIVAKNLRGKNLNDKLKEIFLR